MNFPEASWNQVLFFLQGETNTNRSKVGWFTRSFKLLMFMSCCWFSWRLGHLHGSCFNVPLNPQTWPETCPSSRTWPRFSLQQFHYDVVLQNPNRTVKEKVPTRMWFLKITLKLNPPFARQIYRFERDEFIYSTAALSLFAFSRT